MAVKKRYKQTEVGVIPNDWQVRSIQEISNPVRGGSPRPAGDPRFFDGTFIPWLTVAALTNIPSSQLKVSNTDSCLTEEGSLRSRILYPGTLILANSGATLGVAKILDIKCCANDGIAALLNFNPAISTTYLVHYINTRTQYLRDVVATGNGQPNLNTELIGNFKVPLPPTLTEQEAIAGALSDADAWIESLEQLIAKKRQIKQGAIQELLTGRRRLPGFRGEWSKSSLGELGRWIGGMTPSMSNARYWEGGDFPWVSSGDVKSTRLIDTSQHITTAAIRESATTVMPRGSIIIVNRSGILRRYLPVSLLMRDMAINQDIKGVILKPGLATDFVLYSILHAGPEILSSCMKAGTTVESIELVWLKRFAIALPDLHEQTAIAEVLSGMDAETESLETKLAKARQIKQGMMQELLTGRTRLV